MEKRGKGDMKHKKGLLSRILSQNKQLIIVAVVVVGLSSVLLYKRSTYAEMSEGGKSATTILVPTGIGGIIGGAAGGGKWAAGGLGIGLGAGLIFNAIRKGRANRAQRIENGAPYTRSHRRGRNHIKMNGYPTYNNYNQVNGVEAY